MTLAQELALEEDRLRMRVRAVTTRAKGVSWDEAMAQCKAREAELDALEKKGIPVDRGDSGGI